MYNYKKISDDFSYFSIKSKKQNKHYNLLRIKKFLLINYITIIYLKLFDRFRVNLVK